MAPFAEMIGLAAKDAPTELMEYAIAEAKGYRAQIQRDGVTYFHFVTPDATHVLVSESGLHDAYKELANNEFIVEKIVRHKGVGNGRRFFVKWLGFNSTENTWVRRRDFIDPEMVAQYEQDMINNR
ncbi:hypothetical protein NQ176_g427 [Zarea fungicola]|uniref:Uncharacterized protein n=1 Tax=Zarea fungicola TaxID=93591 RepID=A0ACC1NZF4_9HYPO|nr:hypothetical protein NQ176_g427 [Lecanicillium fungicola]